MQQIDLIAAKAAKATERRALAILAYDNAKQDPDGANWQGIADLLRLAVAIYETRHGDETRLYPNCDGARTWRREIAAENWAARMAQGRQTDRDCIPDRVLVNRGLARRVDPGEIEITPAGRDELARIDPDAAFSGPVEGARARVLEALGGALPTPPASMAEHQLTDAEKAFIARMAPHVMAGRTMEEAAAAVVQDDERLWLTAMEDSDVGRAIRDELADKVYASARSAT
ncbi:hypothetical protein ACVILK_000702 [Bradyrhizobium embrapense]